MRFLGNIAWFLLGGEISAILWALVGTLWCITVVGIPVGLQCFKFALLSMAPFGKDVVYTEKTLPMVVNILWIVLGGAELALFFIVIGCIFCITIVGIPFGKQYFKFAKLALAPLGASIKRR